MNKLSALVFAAALASAASAQDAKVTLHVGDPAPPLKIAKWAKGEPVTELGHGKINVVEFWATWCGPCRQSIPHLTELAKKYGDKAAFIGVDSFEHNPDPASCYSKVEKFVSDMGDQMNYHVAIDGVDGTMGKTWMDAAGQGGIPTAFVVDRDGKVVWIGHPMSGLDEVVGKLIDGTFDAKAEAEKLRMQQAEAEKQQAQQQASMQKIRELLKPMIEAQAAKKYSVAVAELDKVMDKVVAIQPMFKPQLSMMRLQALSEYDKSAAAKYATELAEGPFKNDGNALNELAWTIVKDGSPIGHIDPMVTLHIAKQAAIAAKYEPNVADTLALAFFRAGMFTDALSTQKAAVLRASTTKDFDQNSLKEMKDRLGMYERQANIKPTN
jgi:thiol-disulfide isomerase/thioredoxin